MKYFYKVRKRLSKQILGQQKPRFLGECALFQPPDFDTEPSEPLHT